MVKNNESLKVYSCHFELALDIIGGKWKPIILYYLGEATVLRSNELKKVMPHISNRMLTSCLRELEEDGLIHREIYKEVPPKVEYSLTELGRSIIPILGALKSWGREYNKERNVAKISCYSDERI